MARAAAAVVLLVRVVIDCWLQALAVVGLLVSNGRLLSLLHMLMLVVCHHQLPSTNLLKMCLVSCLVPCSQPAGAASATIK